MLALAVCLAGTLHAQVYLFRFPAAKPPVRIGLAVGYSTPASSEFSASPSSGAGGWEVTVAFNSAHCEILCTYRRKPDSHGQIHFADLVLPPLSTMQVFTEGASRPTLIMVDPAGLGGPRAVRPRDSIPQMACLTPRKLMLTLPVESWLRRFPPEQPPFHPALNYPQKGPAAFVSLRI